MKIIRTVLIAVVSLLLVLSMTSCAVLNIFLEQEKEFRFRDMILTLDGTFGEVKSDNEDGTTFVSLSGLGVIVIEESFEDMMTEGVEDPASITHEQYIDAFEEANEYDATIAEIEGLTAFTYYTSNDGDSYKLLVCIYQSETAFWSVQFMSLTPECDQNEKQFVEWAKQITFAD